MEARREAGLAGLTTDWIASELMSAATSATVILARGRLKYEGLVDIETKILLFQLNFLYGLNEHI